MGKYLQNATNDENYTRQQPGRPESRGTSLTPRGAWQDNGNYIVDCDLRNPAAQNNLATGGDNCGALTGDNANFGNANPNLTIVNPDILRGLGRASRPTGSSACRSSRNCSRACRSMSATTGAGSRTSSSTTTSSSAPSDYTPWTFTAPQHPDLPGGGGYPVTVYYPPVERSARRPTGRSRRISATARTQYWHGVNVSVNARLANGLTFQGGTSTGRGVRDTCDTSKNLPRQSSERARPRRN